MEGRGGEKVRREREEEDIKRKGENGKRGWTRRGEREERRGEGTRKKS